MSSALEVLKKYGEEQGLEAERIPFVLLNGLEEEETLVTFAIGSGGRRAPEVAAAWLKGGPDPSYIEYECRDDTGAPQAIGIVKVQGWIKGSSPASTRACLMLTMLGMWVANFPTELASMSVIAHHHVAKWELNTAVEESLQGQPPQIQERFRRAYAWWGIPVNEEKALFQCREAGKLGALIDGKHGILMDIMDEREKTKWATALLHEFLDILYFWRDNGVTQGFSEMSSFKAFRIIRITRIVKAVRLMRIFRFIMALRNGVRGSDPMLITSIMHTLKSLFWAMVLLVLIMYAFAVLLAQVVNDHMLEQATGMGVTETQAVDKYFGSVQNTMLTLFMSISNGVVTGVFCQSAIDSAQNDHAAIEMNFITFPVFEEKINTPEVRDYFESLRLDIWDAWTFFKMLDMETGRT
eukprot:g1744.t1